MSEELTELKTRIGDIDKTVTEVKALISMRESKSEELRKKVDEIYDFLIGSTDSEKPSMMVRMDRLEQTDRERKWVWATVAALMVNAGWEWLKKR
jgi:hypothetical protein